MKLLVFHIGRDRYALRLRDIARVVPLMELKQLPLAPPYVAGLMDFHGTPVPVIDLARLAGLPAPELHFDSRIVMVDYPLAGRAARPLGLQAEHVLGVTEVDPAALGASGVEAAPFLGAVAGAPGGMLQLVELAALLPPEAHAILFQDAEAPA